MIAPPEGQAIRDATDSLRRLLGIGAAGVALTYSPPEKKVSDRIGPDAIVEMGGLKFLLEYKRSGKATSVANAIERIARSQQPERTEIRLLIVPYMYEYGRARCREMGISWIDLSGNADITGPGIRVAIEGKPNSFRTPGRPSSLFAPKSSRVARILLYMQGQHISQRQISTLTDLGEGYVSRIVRGLEGEGLIQRNDDGAVKVSNPEMLLEAWLEAYRFSKHTIVRGHIPARSGVSLLKSCSETLTEAGVKHAATGLGAAWLYSRFASFRLVTAFIMEAPTREVLTELNFKDGETAANTWLVLPNDESVFWRSAMVDGIPCVHPIQVFLDLKGHPERASEAADEVRTIALGRSR